MSRETGQIAANLELAARWVRGQVPMLLCAIEPVLPAPGAGTGHAPLISRPTEQQAVANVAAGTGWLLPRQRELLRLLAAVDQAATRMVAEATAIHAALPWDDKRWGGTCSVDGCGGPPRSTAGGPCESCYRYHLRHGVWPPPEWLERKERQRQADAIRACGEVVRSVDNEGEG